ARQARLRHLDPDRGGELFNGIADIIPLHETGEGRLATLLALFGGREVDRAREAHDPVYIVAVVRLKHLLQLDVVRLQLLGLRHAPVDLQLVGRDEPPEALEAAARVNDRRGLRVEAPEELQRPGPLLLEVLPGARVDVHVEPREASYVLLAGLHSERAANRVDVEV